MQKQLTKAEEQVMQFIWGLGKGFVKDIVEQFPDPKPAYTTITTIIRILVKKGFIGYNTYGKVNEYYPLISKKEYSKVFMKGVLKGYFNESFEMFTSYFTRDNDLTLSQLEELKGIVDKQIELKRKKENE